MSKDYGWVDTHDKNEVNPGFFLNFVYGARVRYEVRLIKYIYVTGHRTFLTFPNATDESSI